MDKILIIPLLGALVSSLETLSPFSLAAKDVYVITGQKVVISMGISYNKVITGGLFMDAG